MNTDKLQSNSGLNIHVKLEDCFHQALEGNGILDMVIQNKIYAYMCYRNLNMKYDNKIIYTYNEMRSFKNMVYQCSTKFIDNLNNE